MAKTTLTISSKNYSSWSLRGWLLCRFAGLDFETVALPLDDVTARADASSGAVTTSSNSSPENFASSQPRSDQDE